MPSTGQSGPAAPVVTIAAAGWWALTDADTYYPDDLPEDWRLGYFGNDYAAVYLPACAWRNQRIETIGQWAGDVNEAFRFFLEQPEADAPAGMAPPAMAAALGQRLGGWVRWHAEGIGTLLGPAADTSAPAGRVVACPQALVSDLHAGARWLRAQAAAAAFTLIVLARPSSAQLANWRQMQQLLGLAER